MASNDSNECEETECLCAECGDYAEVFNADGTPSEWVRMRDRTTWRCAACEVNHEEDDESECESLPDDPDDHTTGYLMPDGRLVVVDDEQLFIPEIDAAVGIVPVVDDAPLPQEKS